MAITTNENFELLLQTVQRLGDTATLKASQTPAYQQFVAAFPLERLKTLSADEYCVGKGTDSFCRWLERGLEPVLGRYMPGSSRGHIVYFVKKDGSLYKNRHLADLSDEEAVRYTVQVQSAIASADLAEDVRWIDSDAEIFKRAGVAPRVTVGHGRKLRLLALYHPDEIIPISSSAHVGHFLSVLGCPPEKIPEESKPVARMLTLREYFLLAKERFPGLSTYGFMRALYDPELGLAPEKADEDADDSPDGDDEAATSYLLTWNPEHFKIGGDGEVVPGTEHEWTCHSKQPKVGDTVYLARLGVEPRGIVARGTVTEGPHEAPHWKDPSKRARYIKFKVVEFRPSASAGLLPMALLALAAPDQKWSSQISGVGISAAAERTLRELWEQGANRHSLRQFVDWIGATAATQGTELNKWLQHYDRTTTVARNLKADPSQIDQAALDELWRLPENGVSHVGAGTLSNKEFNENLPLLSDLTARILRSPTSETLAEAEAAWNQAVASKRMRMLNRAVIRRVFAAASPELFTTALREADCQKLLALLKRQFELAPARSAGTDWVAMNADIAACMRMAGLDAARSIESNLAAWKLVDYLSAGEKPAPATPLGAEEPATLNRAPEQRSAVAPKNLVLYGPPGTGKTYQTIEEAISILAPEMLEGEPDRASIKAAFDRFVRAGRIVFTTFHQSFSYEDFVEGLRAETDSAGQLRYSVTDGVFKLLCGRGSEPASTPPDQPPPFQPGEEIGGYRVLRCTHDILELEKPNGNSLPIGMSLLEELRGLVLSGRVTVEDIKLRQVFEKVGDTKLEPYLVNGYANVLPSIVERMLPGSGVQQADTTAPGEDPPKVLIIDEINRGNVARIFGELITLIEPTKRAGMPEALSVTLPYSKKQFSVPRNLHIVATMNTADRSLVGLDVALRRRFEFRELEPRPDLLDDVSIEGVSIGSVLRAMNERIEVLLDRDHRLGHAYFLALRDAPTVEALANVFRANVIPLLQEYFFEDYERVRWVLNDHRKPANLQFVANPDAGLSDLFGDGVTPDSRPVRWTINEQAFALADAYAGIVAARS